MSSRVRFPVYHGEKPYAFISYAHVDSARALPIAEELYRRHYRVWYDEGIEAGAHWADFIAEHLEGSAIVLYFPSEQFNSNRNCEREVNYAVEAKKDMACVHLDDAQLPPGLKMQFSTAKSVRASEDPVETANHLIQSGALREELIGDGKEGYDPKKIDPTGGRKFARVIGGLLVALVLFLGTTLFGYTRGWFGDHSGLSYQKIVVPKQDGNADTSDVEVTTWTSPMMRDLLISQTSGEALYCCGNTFVTARSAIDYQKGMFLVGDTAVSRGDISDLKAVAELTQLVELSLCYESITDASALSALAKLTYLDLSGNRMTDISGLSQMKQLATLNLSHTGVTDLTPVLSMTGLKRLYISYDMAPYAASVLSGNFDLIVTE